MRKWFLFSFYISRWQKGLPNKTTVVLSSKFLLYYLRNQCLYSFYFFFLFVYNPMLHSFRASSIFGYGVPFYKKEKSWEASQYAYATLSLVEKQTLYHKVNWIVFKFLTQHLLLNIWGVQKFLFDLRSIVCHVYMYA